MDKAIVITLIPLFAFCLVIGVVVIHVRKGKRLDLKLEGLGIRFSLHSQDKEETNDQKLSE